MMALTIAELEHEVSIKLQGRVPNAKAVAEGLVRCVFLPSTTTQEDSALLRNELHDRLVGAVRVIRSDDGKIQGHSYKLKNIVVNWKRVLSEVPDWIVAAAGGVASEWLFFLTLLIIVRRVCAQLHVELDESHALVLLSLWKIEQGSRVKAPFVSAAINECARQLGVSPPGNSQVDRIIADLIRLGCIKKDNDDEFVLVETVKFAAN